MFQKIMSGVMVLVLLGLGLALLRVFNWDIGLLLEWLWAHTMSTIDAIARFFQGNPTFQKVVQS